jgi:hypothetical protein
MTTTLIVEDGTNVPNANSYISQADALIYFNNKADQVYLAASQDQQAAALFRAGQGLDFWLNGRWYGKRANAVQSLDWPRKDVRDSEGYCVPNNVVPAKVKLAQAEVAKIELTTQFIQQSVDRSNAISKQTVGPIDITYMATAPSITYWPMVIAMLRDYAGIGVMPIEINIGLSPAELRQMNHEGDHFGMNPFDFPDYFHLIKAGSYGSDFGPFGR